MRLTAPDGYTASRSYSVASAPDGTNEIELTVERLDDGEVSTFLHDEVEVGDELEVRGPIGGWFVWDGDDAGAARRRRFGRRARSWRCCGSRAAPDRSDLVHLVVSVRTPDDLYYADELAGPETTVVYTRTRAVRLRAPARRPDRRRHPAADRRRDRARTSAVRPASPTPRATCSSRSASRRERIRVERFGPTG